MPLAPGTRLGNYDIVAPLGAGGMGEVYRARDARLGREVALKVLPADVAADGARLARFEREARTVASLNHPNIVVLYSVEDADGVRFLTMELVDGESLERHVAPGGLPVTRVVELGLALADALVAAHEKGVVHRDLKPANVMLSSAGRVKVLDFGLAKPATVEGPLDDTRAMTLTTPLSGEGLVVGTVPYMAPEQLRGEVADARSDLFSLGVLLYELATGRRPFTGRDPASLISSILRDDPPAVTTLNGALPDDLSDIVHRCLAKSPAERFQSAREVRAELGRVSPEPAGAAATPRAAGGRSAAPVPPPVATAPSIAVLPFRNLSADPDNEYFSDGITEELLNSLAQLRGLKVAARTSSFAFKNQATDLRTVAGKLGVGTVLEGSVRRQGQRVRITAQLVNAADGYQLWSDAFDRQLDDVFAIQADIAERVADALRVTLLQPDADRLRNPDTRNAAAYDVYLHGLQQVASFGVEAVLEAARSFRRATELDPQFARAHAGIANAYLFAYETSAIPLDELLRVAEPAMQRAMQLDPALSEAQTARGGVLAAKRDVEGAKTAFRRALELNPGNTQASHLYGTFLWHHWELEEMMQVYDHALQVDPLDATLQGFRGFGLQTLRRLDEAQADFARARSIDSANPIGYYMGGLFSYDARGDAVEGLTLLRRGQDVDPADPEIHAWVAHLHLALDEHAAAADAAARAVELGPRNGLVLSTRALVHVLRGEDADAFRLARRALEPDVLQRFGSRLVLLRILRLEWLRDGRVAEAVRAYTDAYPLVAQGANLMRVPLEHPQFGGYGELTGIAADLAHLRAASGDDAGSAALVRLVRSTLDRQPRMDDLRLFGFGAGPRIAMLEGRHDEALRALEHLVDAGWIANWRFTLEHDSVWDPVREGGAFQRIVEKLAERTRTQRQRLRG